MSLLSFAMSGVFRNNALGTKDAVKAALCSKFIGFGAKDSSTNRYRIAAAGQANCGFYLFEDVVFVSVNGKRSGAIDINDERYQRELKAAINVGATIVADKAGSGKGCRDSKHNRLGEGMLANFLIRNSYMDTDGNGIWKPLIFDIWFRDTNNCLSNLARRQFVDHNGASYISVEHAYQVWKSGIYDEHCYHKEWKAGSKFVGGFKANIEGNRNIQLMKALMRASFVQNPESKQILMDTGSMVFTHNHDRGIWKTTFPKLLHDLRAEFLAE